MPQKKILTNFERNQTIGFSPCLLRQKGAQCPAASRVGGRGTVAFFHRFRRPECSSKQNGDTVCRSFPKRSALTLIVAHFPMRSRMMGPGGRF